jgi:hypothetical protein
MAGLTSEEEQELLALEDKAGRNEPYDLARLKELKQKLGGPGSKFLYNAKKMWDAGPENYAARKRTMDNPPELLPKGAVKSIPTLSFGAMEGTKEVSPSFGLKEQPSGLDLLKRPEEPVAEKPSAETPKEDMFVATQAKPEEPSVDTGSIRAPRSPEDMTDLNAKIQEMADSYGEHGKALRAEADGLNAQLNTLRSNFQGEMQSARNDYERQRTQQQWAQVGELIGRSLITMAAAARSLQKGKNFVTGLDPRSQVDWLSQLREARADMQDRIDASKATMNMGAESAEEQSKARLAEKGLAWEGKKLSLREQIAGIKGDMQRKEQLADQSERERIGLEREQRMEARMSEKEAAQEQKQQAGMSEALLKSEANKIQNESYQRAEKASSDATKLINALQGPKKEEALTQIQNTLIMNGMDAETAEKKVDAWNTAWFGTEVKPELAADILRTIQSTPGFPKTVSAVEAMRAIRKREGGAATEESSATQGAPGSSRDNPARPQTKEEVLALPSGTWIRNQKTGDVVQKR